MLPVLTNVGLSEEIKFTETFGKIKLKEYIIKFLNKHKKQVKL